jgi:hypothetical protein
MDWLARVEQGWSPQKLLF